jgi:tryptophan synthase beta chain
MPPAISASMAACSSGDLDDELSRAHGRVREGESDPAFQAELKYYLRDYVGRPTPLYFAERLTDQLGRREDRILSARICSSLGAHKINNAVGQSFWARRLGKRRIIAETGAGQHGVATRRSVHASASNA